MSRAYKIEISGVNINFSDKNTILEIELLPILDKEKMNEIFKECLKNKNALEKNDTLIINAKEEINYKIDLEKRTLEVDITGRKKDIDFQMGEEVLSSKMKNLAVENTIKIDGSDTELLEEISAALKRKTKSIEKDSFEFVVKESLEARQFLNNILKEVYKEAIKEKAQSIGNVTSMQESEENGEYRVRIEIE